MQFHDYQPKGESPNKPKLHVNIPPNEEALPEKKEPKKRAPKQPRKTQLIDTSGEMTPKTPNLSADDESGSHKRKKFRATFPQARIKRIMQADEEVGKIAASVPLLVSKCLELFIASLVDKTKEITKSKNSKTMSLAHLKECIEATEQFNFLEEKVKHIVIPAPSETPTKPKRTRAPKAPKEPKDPSEKKTPKKRGRKKKEEEEEEEDDDDDEESVEQKGMMGIPFQVQPQQPNRSPVQPYGQFQPPQSPTRVQQQQPPPQYFHGGHPHAHSQIKQPDTPRPNQMNMPFMSSPNSQFGMQNQMPPMQFAPPSPNQNQTGSPQFKPPQMNPTGSPMKLAPPTFNSGGMAPPAFNTGGMAPPTFNTGGMAPPAFTGGMAPPQFNSSMAPPAFNTGSAPLPFSIGGGSPLKPPPMQAQSPKEEVKE